MTGGRKVGAVIPAAGSGARMGGAGSAAGGSKLFLPLAGTPVLVRTLRAFEEERTVDDVVLVLRPEDQARAEELLAGAGIRKVRRIVPGGEERQDSVRLGLAALLPLAPAVVIVHDAARPFVSGELIEATAAAALRDGAAVAAVRPKDTVKMETGEGGRLATQDRGRCWLAQTPQAFRTEILAEAMEKAVAEGYRGTDDAALVERLGRPIVTIEGSTRNLKVTTPEDLEFAEFLLRGGDHPPS